MNHGKVTTKENLGDVVKKGEEGIITAYLPDMEKFAVLFSNKRWLTFSETETIFLQRFDVELNSK